MNASFAYFEGQEAQALVFYERRLRETQDPEERRRLERLVQELRAVVEETKQPLPDFSLSALSLRCVQP